MVRVQARVPRTRYLHGLLVVAGAQAQEHALPGRVHHGAAAGRVKVERRVALAHAQEGLHLAQAGGVAAQRGLPNCKHACCHRPDGQRGVPRAANSNNMA